MLLKAMLAKSPRSFRNNCRDNKCFLGFLNNSNKKMPAPHALDIAGTITSLIVSRRFTFVGIFKISSSSSVMHWSAELRPKEGRKDRPSE